MAKKRKAKKAKAAVSHRTLKAEMRRLERRSDALLKTVRRAEVDVRKRSAAQLRKLKARQALAKQALAKLGRQSAAASGPLKAGLRKAWRDIEAAMKRARRRFRETA